MRDDRRVTPWVQEELGVIRDRQLHASFKGKLEFHRMTYAGNILWIYGRPSPRTIQLWLCQIFFPQRNEHLIIYTVLKRKSHWFYTLQLVFFCQEIIILKRNSKTWTMSSSKMSVSEVTGRISSKAAFSRSSSIFTYPIARIIHRYQGYESLPAEFTVLSIIPVFTFMHWRRKWQPTSVFLPGESQGQRSLVGCHLWGHTESDTTEAT